MRRLAPELGGVNSGLHLEFLQGVDGRQERIGVEVDVGVGDAVEGVVVELAAHAGNREVLRTALSALTAHGGSAIREGGIDVGAQSHELQEIASIERQLDDALIVDYRADRGVLRGKQRSAARHLDGFGHGADPELKIDAGHLLNLQLHAAPELGLEALHLRSDVVNTRLQRRKRVIACVIRGGRSREIGLRIGDSHGSADDHRAAGISHHTGDFTGRLPEQQSQTGGQDERRSKHRAHGCAPSL